MLVQEILDIYKLLDRQGKVGQLVVELFQKEGVIPELKEVSGPDGSTEFIKIVIPGAKDNIVSRHVLGVIGRLGGIGARPSQIGFVSDGDGALTALSVALKLARMRSLGDMLQDDVIITTHLCTNAPTAPHDPVPFMGSPVDLDTMNAMEVDSRMSAVLSIDTSRGNRIINNNNFAITPTVKEGWILKVNDDLLTTMEYVTGMSAAVTPITMQDITPYSNGFYHFNSIMTPSSATASPVVGVALTSTLPVPGCATGVTRLSVIDEAGRFVIEVAKSYTAGKISFYDEEEYQKIINRYGDMKKLQK